MNEKGNCQICTRTETPVTEVRVWGFMVPTETKVMCLRCASDYNRNQQRL